MMTEAIEYTTRNMQLACTLGARGHFVVPGGITKQDGTVYYTFPNKDVADDVRAWHEGRPLEVNLHSLWLHYFLFRSVLHGSERDMQIIVSLLTMGNKEESITKDNGVTRYHFEGEKAKDDTNLFLEMREVMINASDFWFSMGQFKRSVH
jgi:hypothetical protein